MDRKPTKGEFIEVLLRSSKNIFTVKDIALLWRESGTTAFRVRLSDYVKKGKLVRVCRGIYAKDEDYDRFELATRIYTPSYISFETVLTRAGVSFQYYDKIFVASYVTREIEVGDQKISFIRMKDYVLSDTRGIDNSNDAAVATKERAFLDRVYVSQDYHFDNMNVLNWEKVFEILPIYCNQRMKKKVEEYYKHYKNSNLE